MNVDLLSALDAREAERPASESSNTGDRSFPDVLGENLRGQGESDAETGTERGDRDGRASSDPSDGRDPESAESDARNPDTASGTSNGPGHEARAEEEAARNAPAEEDAQAAIDVASLGAAGSVLAERMRSGASAEADVEVDGRLTALERADEGAARGRAFTDRPEERSTPGGGELDAAQRASFDAIAAGLERANVSESTREPAAGVRDLGASEGRESVVADGAEVADRSAFADEESGARDFGQQQERSAERQDSASEIDFERAADGVQGSQVDAGLRAALATRDESERAPDAIAVAGGTTVANPIAGAITETTPSAPGAPQPAVASDAIAVQTEWLATRGGGSARLVLHPPELGELAIRVTLRGGAVDVVMVAQEAIAQSVAEEQGDRLAQALVSRDLRMEQFEVRQGDPDSLSDGASGFARGSEEEGGREAGRETGASDEDGGRAARGLLGRRDDGPETTPQILSAGAESGVDLRA